MVPAEEDAGERADACGEAAASCGPACQMGTRDGSEEYRFTSRRLTTFVKGPSVTSGSS
mgnify:FL=1